MQFDTLYADPPWKYENERDNDPKMGGMTYKTMELEEIKALGPLVQAISHRDTVLFMWATFPKLQEAFAVLDAWGFSYVTTPFVWVKLNPTGKLVELEGKPIVGPLLKFLGISNFCKKLTIFLGGIYSGMGSWTNGNAEIILMGKRRKSGKPKRLSKKVKQIVVAPRSEHSAKPPEVRDRIVALVDGNRRLEMFARPCVAPDWKLIGIEVTGNDIAVDLKELADA